MSMLPKNICRVGCVLQRSAILSNSLISGGNCGSCQRSQHTASSERVEPNGYSTVSAYSLKSNQSGQDGEPGKVERRLEMWKSQVDPSQLTDLEQQIHKSHMDAVQNGEETYSDPATEFKVMTVLSHLRRGTCCGNLCRHCPYGHENVSVRYKSLKHYNKAFYN